MSQFAWVTLATNDSYSLGALVVAHSLKRVHTAHQLAVLITPGVSEAMKIKLHNVFNVVQEVNLLDSKDNANLALLKRPELGITFTKLHCWRLTQFEKCVFLDADTLVLRNCDELFEREELSAAPDVGWPDCFNSGVFVFRPSLDTFSSLMQFAVTNGSFDGGDQGLLNQYFSDWAHKDISKHLPFVYNTSSVASYSYLPAFKQFGQNTKILHFIGTAKPWLQNFNSETRKVYTPGGFQHLANFLQYWWDIFCEDVHSRLSTDMSEPDRNNSLSDISIKQLVFSPWIKPSKVSGSAYRSSGTGSFYTEGGSGYGGGGGFDRNGNFSTYQQHREAFIPSYDTTAEYVDPWDEYLRKQEKERERKAREQQKREEERLYYQYLDNLRLQEQQRQNHELMLQQEQHQQEWQHHVHPDHSNESNDHHHYHHDHHQESNVFQSVNQWVEHVHDQGGHWEQEQIPFRTEQDSVQPMAGGSGGGSGDGGDGSQQLHVTHDHLPPQAVVAGIMSNIEKFEHGASASGGDDGGQHHQHGQVYHQEEQPQQQHNDQPIQGDGAGLAGALAQLHLGEPKSVEQEAYVEHMRRQCWESGNIDYMGRDSFDNIWRRIQQTLNGGSSAAAASAPTETAEAPAPAPAPVRTVSPAPPRFRSSKSRSRSTTPKRDPRDRSPTPQPEDTPVPVEKKEGN